MFPFFLLVVCIHVPSFKRLPNCRRAERLATNHHVILCKSQDIRKHRIPCHHQDVYSKFGLLCRAFSRYREQRDCRQKRPELTFEGIFDSVFFFNPLLNTLAPISCGSHQRHSGWGSNVTLGEKNPEINTRSYKHTHWFIYMCNTSRHSQWNNTTTVLGFIAQVVATDSAVSSIKRL